MKTREPIPATDIAGGSVLALRVTPRAGRTSIAGVRGGRLLVRLAAAPVEGAANEALVRFLAGTLEIPNSRITLLSGERSREKCVRVAGLCAADVTSRLSVVVPDTR